MRKGKKRMTRTETIKQLKEKLVLASEILANNEELNALELATTKLASLIRNGSVNFYTYLDNAGYYSINRWSLKDSNDIRLGRCFKDKLVLSNDIDDIINDLITISLDTLKIKLKEY